MNFSFMMFYGRFIYREGGLKTKSSIIGGGAIFYVYLYELQTI